MASITVRAGEPLKTSREIHTLHVIRSTARDQTSALEKLAMADDWDVEDLLEAPFKKGAEKVSFFEKRGILHI